MTASFHFGYVIQSPGLLLCNRQGFAVMQRTGCTAGYQVDERVREALEEHNTREKTLIQDIDGLR